MSGVGSRGSYEHIRGRGFEALDTKSTWSSFDDITWEDYGDVDDHSVPEPNNRAPPTWSGKKKLWIREIKGEAAAAAVAAAAPPCSKMDPEAAAAMDVESWDNLNVGELGAVPDNLTGIGNELKQESGGDDGLPLLDGYNDEVASIVTSSGHFSFSAVPSEEEMTIFGADSDGGKATGLLGYAWESLEDMDTLFQTEEAPFGQDATDALLQWPASSSPPDSNPAAANAKASPELRAMKGKSHDQDMKMEFIPCESFDKSASSPDAEAAAAAAMDLSSSENNHDRVASQNVDKTAAKDPMEPLLFPRGKPNLDADKAHSGKRQSSNKKRSDERAKKQLCPRRPGISYTKQQTLPHYSSSQPLQLKPSVASTLQVYPQVMGQAAAMHHPGQYLGPVHPTYLMQPGQSQHSMICYDQGDAQSQQRFGPEPRQKLELLSPSPPPPPPPPSGSNMTPQEKIDKLRWKQKMHRLASEQHQQMAKQCGLSINQQTQAAADAETKPGPPPAAAAGVKPEEGDGASPAVLNQLLSIMTKLDVGTRICIRDALYRLARSAINRNTTDGPSSSEGSNNSDNTLSRAIRYPLLETETNPIDRTIANLLFHKRSSSSPNYSNSSNSAGSVVNIAAGLQEAQVPWPYQQQATSSRQQDQQIPSETGAAPPERSATDCSSRENAAAEASDGSKKMKLAGGGGGGAAGGYSSSRSGGQSRRQHASSSSEFLSSGEGRSSPGIRRVAAVAIALLEKRA